MCLLIISLIAYGRVAYLRKAIICERNWTPSINDVNLPFNRQVLHAGSVYLKRAFCSWVLNFRVEIARQIDSWWRGYVLPHYQIKGISLIDRCHTSWKSSHAACKNCLISFAVRRVTSPGNITFSPKSAAQNCKMLPRYLPCNVKRHAVYRMMSCGQCDFILLWSWLPLQLLGGYLWNRIVDFTHFRQVNLYGRVDIPWQKSLPCTQYLSYERISWFPWQPIGIF